MNIKLTHLLLIILTVFSCSNDDLKDTENNFKNTNAFTQNQFTVKVINASQVKNKTITNKLLKFNKSKTNNLRSIYNADYGFTINTDKVTYLVDHTTGQESYNFAISRDVVTSLNLENLVFLSDDNGNFNSYIVTYGFTEQDLLNNNTIALEANPTVYTQINLDLDTVLNEKIYYTWTCYPTSYNTDPSDQHDQDVGEGGMHGELSNGTCTLAGCNYGQSTYISTGSECYFSTYDDGGASEPTGSGIYNPNSGNGHPNGTSVTTNGTVSSAPMINDECIDDEQAITELENIFGQFSIETDCEIDFGSVPTELHFNTPEELQSFLEELQDTANNDGSDLIQNDDPLEMTKTAKFKFNDFLTNYNLYVKQNIGVDMVTFSDYSVEDVTSDTSGITLFGGFTITSWDNSLNSYNSITDVYGDMYITIFYKGVGRILTDSTHFRLITNATDGSPISQEWIDEWVFD